MEHDEEKHGAVAGVLPLLASTQEHKPTTPVRPCLDYHSLNELLHSSPGMQAPVCAEKLREWRMAGEASDSVLINVKKAYLQIHVHPDLVRYQGVIWRGKVYVMTRMGFGLSIAPSLWISLSGG